MSDQHSDADLPDPEQPSDDKHVFDDDPDMPAPDDHSPQPHPSPNAKQCPPSQTVDDENPPQAPPETSSGAKPSAEPREQSASNNSLPIKAAPADPAASSPAQSPVQQTHPTSDDNDDLYSKLSSHPASVPGLVTDWSACVQVNGPVAVADLLSLVVRMARPDTSTPLDLVTPQMVIANDPRAALSEVACVLHTDVDGRVPAVAKDPVSRRVRRAFEDFWMRLAAESSHAVLFDTDCFDTLISWLESMAVTRSRALRTVACLAAYRLVDGFVDFGNRLRKQLASMQRQLATEKRKCGVAPDQIRTKGRGKASAQANAVKALSKKGGELAKKVDEMTANNSELVELAGKVFDSIFILKYRDVSPEIRTISVTALGSWIMSYPDHFLDDKHTKYIGWLLSDKDPVVRRSTLEILRRMLRKKDFYQSLQLFLERFCDRIVEMSRDKDESVAVAALRLLTKFTEYEILDEKSCYSICDIALEEMQTDIRRAAGEFLVSLIDVEEGKDDSQPIQGKRKSHKSAHAPENSSKPSQERMNPDISEIPSVERSCHLIRELLFIILREDGNERKSGLAVNAVWNFMPALRCWDAFAAILMNDQNSQNNAELTSRSDSSQVGGHDESLSEDEKAVLCEVLLASVRESNGRGDLEHKTVVARVEENSSDTPTLTFSRCFLPALHQILVQFQTNVRALRALIQFPVYFHMECFEQEGQGKHFQEILIKILDIMSRHTGSPDLVDVCASTFRVLLSDRNPLRTVTLKSLQNGYSSAAKELSLQVRADLSKAEPLTVAAALLRVRVLSELIEPTSPVHDVTVKVMQYQIEKGPLSELNDDVTTDAARTGCALIMWSLCKVRSRLVTSNGDKTISESLALEEVQETHRQGAVTVDVLRQVCSSTAFSISARIVCLQALLTTLTLCRGVEKFAARLPSQHVDGETLDGRRGGISLDFLHSRPQIDSLVDAVRFCILSVIEHDQELRDHNVPSRNNGRTKKRRVALPETAIKDCFASLVQASCQSVLSGKISHLPLLGLLLRRKKPTPKDPTHTEWTAFELCRKYSQRRQVKEIQRVREEVRALRDASRLQKTKQRNQITRELGELIIGTRAPGEPMRKAAKELLDCLTHFVLEAHSEGVEVAKAAEILSVVGFSLVTRISVNDARGLMEKLENVTPLLQRGNISPDSIESSLFFTFLDNMQAVASGKAPEVPKLSKQLSQIQSRQTQKALKKRKRRKRDSGAFSSASPVDVINVRRSSRERKKVDYAQLLGLNRNDSESDNSDENVSDAEHEESRLDKPGRPTTAAEAARDMMEFTNSPRIPQAPSKSLPKELHSQRNARNVAEALSREAGKRGRSRTKGSRQPECEVKASERRGLAEKTLPEEGPPHNPERASSSGNSSTGATQDGADDGGSDNDTTEKQMTRKSSTETVVRRMQKGVDGSGPEEPARSEFPEDPLGGNLGESSESGADGTEHVIQSNRYEHSALPSQNRGSSLADRPQLDSQQSPLQSPKENASSPSCTSGKRKKLTTDLACEKENIDESGVQEIGKQNRSYPIIRRKRRRRW